MKTLNEILLVSTRLNKQEMKRIAGGAVGGNCCAYNADWKKPGFTCMSGGGTPMTANFMAGADGWWACNSAEVIAACGTVCPR